MAGHSIKPGEMAERRKEALKKNRDKVETDASWAMVEARRTLRAWSLDETAEAVATLAAAMLQAKTMRDLDT